MQSENGRNEVEYKKYYIKPRRTFAPNSVSDKIRNYECLDWVPLDNTRHFQYSFTCGACHSYKQLRTTGRPIFR